jgi:hypothetical protein
VYRHALPRSLFGAVLILLAAMSVLSPLGGRAALADEPAPSADIQVMQAFTEQIREGSERQHLSDQRKHAILFLMGIALLICMLTTAGLGIAMAIYGKKVFVAHTVFAGLSITLAIVHAVVAIVWFWPF